ncbi:MAG TPA: GNAT family protein, partial [Acidobacteriota bacterium]|nr:GNAT family protein [Acidobacteriota bacterium]
LIRTPRLKLRDFSSADFAAVHAYASDPMVTEYLSWGPNDKSMTRDFLTAAEKEARQTQRPNYSLAIVLSETDAVIGGCGLIARRLQYAEYEIGYCLARDFWGRGLATEVVNALLDFGFHELNAHRIFGTVDPANAASSRLLEKTGFRFEGLQKSDMFARDKWYDSKIYAILAEEWK